MDLPGEQARDVPQAVRAVGEQDVPRDGQAAWALDAMMGALPAGAAFWTAAQQDAVWLEEPRDVPERDVFEAAKAGPEVEALDAAAQGIRTAG